MKVFTRASWLALSGAALICCFAAQSIAADPPADVSRIDGAYEELTRGPIHEAFAEQVNLDPQPGVVAPKPPPEPVKELPPENKPADEAAIWIDGYWAYDDAQERYLWVSGVWRIAPRGYAWVPGYWTKTDSGHQWIGGFWSTGERSDVAYQPLPPNSLEDGPTSPAPGDGHVWVPGCWYLRDGQYVWRPGYWIEGSDQWVWIPNYYRWTPRGCVLVGGYWDVPPASRGCLFAPVRFNEPLYAADDWYYTPNVLIDTTAWHLHLFVRPSYCHYYFGDYYDDYYVGRGWYPWYSFHQRRHCYDPLYAFNHRYYHRRGIDFGHRIRGWHDYFQKHREHRPQHTYAKQERWKNSHRDFAHVKQASVGDSFGRHARDQRDRFVRLSDEVRRSFGQQGRANSEFRNERSRVESVADAGGRRVDGQTDVRTQISERNLPRLRLPDARQRVAVGRKIGQAGADAGESGGNRTLRPDFNGRATSNSAAPTRPRAVVSGGSAEDFRRQLQERAGNLRSRGTTGGNPSRSQIGNEVQGSTSRRSFDRGTSQGVEAGRSTFDRGTENRFGRQLPGSAVEGNGSSFNRGSENRIIRPTAPSGNSSQGISPRTSGSFRSPSSANPARSFSRPDSSSFGAPSGRTVSPGFSSRSTGPSPSGPRAAGGASSGPSSRGFSSPPSRSASPGISPGSSRSTSPGFAPRSSSPSPRSYSPGPSRSVSPGSNRSSSPGFAPRSSTPSSRSYSPSPSRSSSRGFSSPSRSSSPGFSSRSSGSSRGFSSPSSRSGRSSGFSGGSRGGSRSSGSSGGSRGGSGGRGGRGR